MSNESSNIDLKQFIEQFQDYVAPKLDPYEQTIYLYIFRNSRLLGVDEIVIGFKSAAKRMAWGRRGKVGLSVDAVYQKLQSLQSKGCIEIVSNENNGLRIRLRLPSEITGMIPPPTIPLPPISIEDMDFFSVTENRHFILTRESHSCFYCMRSLNAENYVIEHVVSRPEGNNSYRNLVAACRECNNRKNDSSANDFLRMLYRESFLTASELQACLQKIERLKNGELKPKI
jgi:hypothetical protein